MSVNIGQSLQEGLTRTFSRNGILLIVIWAIIGGLSQLASNTWLASFFSGLSVEPTTLGPTLDIPALYAGIGALVFYLVSFVIMAGAIRTFVSDNTYSVPRSNFTRNLIWMLLNLTVGFVIFYLAIVIGSILLLIPGLFLLVSLYFWFVFVIVEDENFYEAFQSSWALARGNRWTLAGIGLIVLVAGWIIMGIPMAIAAFISPWIALVLFGLSVSIFAVFSFATTARVYVQLTAETL